MTEQPKKDSQKYQNVFEKSPWLANELFSIMLNSINDGIIALDSSKKVIFLNNSAEKLTGWHVVEAIGKQINEIFHLASEKDENITVILHNILEGKEEISQQSQALLLSKAGNEYQIEKFCSALKDHNGAIIGALVTFRDITERLKLEQEILRSQKLDSVGMLAGGIAHDFNNILNAILGNISLARLVIEHNDEAFQMLYDAEKATQQAAKLTQQLLTFSKGGAPIKKFASITDLLKDTVDFSLRGSNIKPDFSLPKDLLSTDVDREQLSQAIQNVVLNSVQSMPDGGKITVSASNRNIVPADNLPLKPGPYIQISIKDSGKGIEKENMHKIFEPYYTTKENAPGLGLTTSYSIVKNHDGHLTVESKPGEGTNTYIYLPIHERPESEIPATKTSPKQEIGQLKPVRILLMDDEIMLLRTTSKLLKAAGNDVITAKTGEEAIELFKDAQNMNKPFDIVILDLTIRGGLGGKETIKRLSELDPNINAIVSSGYANNPVMLNYQEYNFKAVIPKPYFIDELKETINKIIMEKGG